MVIVGNRIETREEGLILPVRFSMELKSVAEMVYVSKLVGKGLWRITWGFRDSSVSLRDQSGYWRGINVSTESSQ
jgi:hypothetical protein